MSHFFFKTHHPHNRSVGGGLFSGFAPLRISEAWELFGLGNGMDGLDGMRRLVGRYRKRPIQPAEDPTIGCVFICDTTFFPADQPADPPPSLKPNVVQGRGYELADPEFAGYFEELPGRLPGVGGLFDTGGPWRGSGPTYGDTRLTPQRLGQQAFQAVVLRACARRCPCCRRRTSGRCRRAVTTGSTTVCCSDRTGTRCTTVATWVSTRASG